MIKSRSGARWIFTEALIVRVHHNDEVDLKKALKTIKSQLHKTRADRSSPTSSPGRFPPPPPPTSKARKKGLREEVGLSLGLLERDLITGDVNKHT